MGQNDTVVGQILPFGQFPYEKINKTRVKKVENKHSPNLLYKTQDDLIS